jgi:hypothetical protein
MIEYEIADEFPTNPDKYWDMFFSDAYNEALWKHLDIERQVLEFRREGEGASLRKLVKDAISYEERNVWRRATNAMDVVTIPNFFADKFIAKGVYKLEPLGDDKLRRVWKASCECKVPLVGGKVEKHVVDEVKRSYQATTIFTRKWIQERLA